MDTSGKTSLSFGSMPGAKGWSMGIRLAQESCMHSGAQRDG